MTFLGVTIGEPNDNRCSLSIFLCFLALALVCHSILPFFTLLYPLQPVFSLITNVGIILSTSSLISNVGRTTSTSSSLFISSSLILDATNSPFNPLLIPLCNLFRKLSNFYNKLPASCVMFSLKL